MSDLLVREDGAVAWLTMNRPDRLNALNTTLADGLLDYFTQLRTRADIRVVVLTGAGRAFCAGLDLGGHPATQSKSTVLQSLFVQNQFNEIILAMRRCPQPVVGLINGVATGGGMALVLATDIRIGTRTARMNAAFIRVGLSACELGVSYLMPRLVGSSVAAEILFTGRFLEPERALTVGLFSKIVGEHELEGEAKILVADLLKASPLGLKLTKEALNSGLDAPSLEAAMALESRSQVLAMQDGNFAEGVAAFREKREPRFQ